MRVDWFERITGFRESGRAATRRLLAVDGDCLISRVNGSRHGIGRLELCTLESLRGRAGAAPTRAARTTVRCLAGDARALHADPAFEGAVFQVASQFNLLEMVSPEVGPEDGVTRYADDHTQGPACAIAAGAATIYRNDFVALGRARGQTAQRQIDALAPLGAELASLLHCPPAVLWTMRNGYALCTREGLHEIGALLRAAPEGLRDRLRGRLAIGLHQDVEVTDAAGPRKPKVSQAFCSALPVAYTAIEPAAWEPFARLVLEAAYEATLLAAAVPRRAGRPPTVLLTRLGGGAFGNDDAWIDAAIERALRRAESAALDVVLVSHGTVEPAMRAIERRWRASAGRAGTRDRGQA